METGTKTSEEVAYERRNRFRLRPERFWTKQGKCGKGKRKKKTILKIVLF
jgi:hypothetical protein